MKDITISDLKDGYTYDNESKAYQCLFCNTKYESGFVYPFGNKNAGAGKAIELHIHEKHGSVFEQLLLTDKSQIGLTDTQKEYLSLYHSGLPDKEIAEKMNISASTVRYQRFNFKEKAKQAKYILALYELLEEEKITIPQLSEEEKMYDSLFESMSPLVLKTFDVKEKKKVIILQTIVKQFEKGRIYTHKEVDAILKQIYTDHATLRRYLIVYGYMERTDDNKEYWVK